MSMIISKNDKMLVGYNSENAKKYKEIIKLNKEMQVILMIKNLKGTFDYMPKDMKVRNDIIGILRSNFEKY